MTLKILSILPFGKAAFLVRLILRGLTHIQATPPEHSPQYMVQIVTDAVHRLRQEFAV